MRKGPALFSRSRTMVENLKKKSKGSINKKDKKKLAQVGSHDGKIDEIEEMEGDDEGVKNSSKAKDSNDNDEEKDKVGELKDDNNGHTVHKKRRRKNVESKDAQTQTDRSDYMVIKQRQQEKQLKALLASKNKNADAEAAGNRDTAGNGR